MKVELPERVTAPVPINLRIRQQPAQGTARLTLVAAEDNISFRSIELHWEHMTAEDLTPDQVLDRLREEPADVPPMQPQPCHRLLWTANYASAGGSMVQLLPLLVAQLKGVSPTSDDLEPLLAKHSLLLTRRSSPALLTQQRQRDWTLYRAVSSDGAVPEPDDNLLTGLLSQFDTCLEDLDEIITAGRRLDKNLRTAIVRLGGWCFQRCPNGIRRHLLDTARAGKVHDVRIYFRAMGKVFVDKEDCQDFFKLLERQLTGRGAKFKLNEIEGLFYLLSLRETAPLALTDHQATLFATKLLARIQECVRSRKQLSRLVNASLKAYAGLMRYRLVRADYMTPQDPALGEEQQQVLDSVLKRSQRDNRVQIARLTKKLIEWSEKRGTDRTILEWDPEDG